MDEMEPPAWVRRGLSEARFAPYLSATGGSFDAAISLYRWNVEVSEAFYPALHFIEVGLRNALHDCLRSKYGRSDWWMTAPLDDFGKRKVSEAIEKCRRRTKGRYGPDHVVAELSFGFWVSLLSKAYDRSLWVPTLHRAFPNYRASRWQLHDWLQSVVLFRNRIMHYEHIHTRDLTADLAKIQRLLGYFEPELVAELSFLDRAENVLARRPSATGEESAGW